MPRTAGPRTGRPVYRDVLARPRPPVGRWHPQSV